LLEELLGNGVAQGGEDVTAMERFRRERFISSSSRFIEDPENPNDRNLSD
jgi:hypothetical protein